MIFHIHPHIHSHNKIDNENVIVQFEYESKYGGKRIYNAYFEGVVVNLARRYRETNSDFIKSEIMFWTK